MTPRVLFVVDPVLGFATFATALAELCEHTTRAHASLLRVELPRPLTMLARRVQPRGDSGRLDANYRRCLLQRRNLRRYRSVLAGADVVVGVSHLTAWALMDHVPRGARLVAVADSSQLAARSMRSGADDSVTRHRHAPLLELERQVVARVDQLVVQSHWAARSFARLDPSPPLVVIRHLMPPSDRADARAVVERPDRTVLFVGNDWRRKGGPELVDWYRDLGRTDVRLRVASSGAPARLNRIPGVVAGPIDRRRLVRDVLPTARVLAMPTKHDMSPNAISEALAAGVPVVATDIAGLRETVGPGGWTGPSDLDGAMGEQLERILDDDDHHRDLALAAVAHAGREFDPYRNFDRLLDVALA